MRLTVKMVILLLVLSLIPLSVVTAQGAASITARNEANVRGGPGLGFWYAGLLSPGETVPVLGVSPDGAWWYIRASFGNGWVAASVVDAYNTAGVGVYDPGTIISIVGAEVNARSGPGVTAAVLGKIQPGGQVYLLGQNADGTWLNVQSQYGNSWIAAEYTSVGGAASSGGGVVVTSAQPYAIVNAAYLNIRSGPGVSYSILGTVEGGDQLLIIGQNADASWFNVETVFGEGWVSDLYVITRNYYGSSPDTTYSIDPSTIVGPTAVINTGALNVRSGPSAAYTVLGVVRGGDQYEIIARNVDFSWVVIETATFTGWVNRIYVIIRGDTSTLGVASAGSTFTAPGGGTVDVPPTVIGPIAFVATGALNIRSGPNAVFDTIGVVYAGTRMSIVGNSPDLRWWQVSSPFGLGWVNKAYIIVEGDASGVPIVQ
ncbi:MAG: SH3 domain-containing protein [Anaerolineales bacterium]|nr:SH3 domain-containing protein [Anaerolineales bacterium]